LETLAGNLIASRSAWPSSEFRHTLFIESLEEALPTSVGEWADGAIAANHGSVGVALALILDMLLASFRPTLLNTDSQVVLSTRTRIALIVRTIRQDILLVSCLIHQLS